jgi:hypothetical protein
MTLGRKLTPEEIAEIANEITPIHRVHRISQSVTYLDAERDVSKMSAKRRSENVDKIRSK